MRLIEIRLLEGPSVYRLEPVVKVEVAVGPEHAWAGSRDPRPDATVRLGAAVRPAGWPSELRPLIEWIRRLCRETGEHGSGRRDRRSSGRGVGVHRGSDPGHWIVAFPWRGAERARCIGEAAIDLAAGGGEPGGAAARYEEWLDRIRSASASPPGWIRDEDRSMPIVSITGTNGKSTVTRLISHILLLAGRRVGTTTSDGVLVGERMVDPGDWTGPGGAAQVLSRGDIDVAVLETARGGILLRGVGYESNEVSVLTNVSSDHLDLQGIHTLPELAQVKATICRMTVPGGWAVLNADDPWVAGVARVVEARVALFSRRGIARPVLAARLRAGGRAYLVHRGRIVELEGDAEHPIVPVADVPITLGGLARHNVENALAAAAAARALGLTIEEVARGLADFRPSTERSPGRLNIFRQANRVVVVDFAHNEAGIEALLDVAEGIAAGGAARTWPITAIIGTAGDRPDDTLRGIGRAAGRRAQRVAIKETIGYLRGRDRESLVDELRAGIAAAGMDPGSVPVYESEVSALAAELSFATGAIDGGVNAGRVITLMCHSERDEVFALLHSLGARPVDTPAQLQRLVPRLEERPRR